MSKKVAEVIVEVLEQAGVKRCYGIVGDTLNLFAENRERSSIDWLSVRHEEAGAFAAGTEALYTNNLAACAGSCGPGSLHFINGLYEANRNRAPVVLIASQVAMSEMGFEFIQEMDFKSVFKEYSVFCEMILTPERARKKAVMACQAALARRGVAVLIVPVDVSHGEIKDDYPYRVHHGRPTIRPSDADIEEIARILNDGKRIAIYAGSGSEGALDEIVAVAERLKAPVAHTSRAKCFLEPGNPYNIGMTGILGNEAGYNALFECDTLLLLGADFAWRQFYPDEDRIVQIDIDPTHLGRRHHITFGAVGDIQPTLQALLPHLARNDDASFQEKYVVRYTESMTSARKQLAPGHNDSIPGSYLTSVINHYADDDALFCGDDGTPVVMGPPSSRSRRQTPDLRQPSARHDGDRPPERARAAKGMSRPSGHRDVRRRWPLDALRRASHHDPGRLADQDRRIRQQQARLCGNRTEVRGDARHVHTPEESRFRQGGRGNRPLGENRPPSLRTASCRARVAGSTRSRAAERRASNDVR